MGTLHIIEENFENNSVYLDKLCQFFGRIIDENDMTFEIRNNYVFCEGYPFSFGPTCDWENSSELPEKSTIEAALDNPEEMSKIKSTFKAGMKKRFSMFKVSKFFKLSLQPPYPFLLLKEAKEFMTTEDFSYAMFIVACQDHFEGEFFKEENFSKDDLLELLKACDPHIFGTELLPQYYRAEEELTVYLEFDNFEGMPDPSMTFSWFSSPEKTIKYCLENVITVTEEGLAEQYGVHTAKIKTKDIFGYFDRSIHGFNIKHDIILNPDKLYDIEKVEDITQWYEYHDDEWEDRYEDEDEDEE